MPGILNATLVISLTVAAALLPLDLWASAPERPDDVEVAALLESGDAAAAEAAASAWAGTCTATTTATDCYRAAHAAWVLAILRMNASPDAVANALADCGRQAAMALGDAVYKPEAQALLSGCYGLSIAVNPAKGMSLGPESAELLAQALAAAPDSPRVHYFIATRLARTPAQWGGDMGKALEHAQRAVELAEAQTEEGEALHWGLAEAKHLRDELTGAKSTR